MKKNLRNEMIDKRNAISKDARIKLSEQIMQNFLNSEYYHASKVIMAFIDFGSEPVMSPLLQKIINDDKSVSLPVTFKKERKIIPSRIRDINDLEIGAYGIRTPKKEKIEFIDPETLDLIITPGVIFDKRGYRIGYGGGYYDRFFEKYPDILRIGYAFSFQFVDEVPINKTDLPINALVTNQGIIKF